MKRVLVQCVLATALSLAATTSTFAQATTPAFSSQETPIGELLDNPATRAVLEKLVPTFVHAERVDEARPMTIREVQPYAAETFTEEIIAKIDAELAKIPPAEDAAK
jgi:para-nitrobenzyl esterase